MEQKSKVAGLLADNATGLEVFLLLLLGQVGSSLSTGKPVSVKAVAGNVMLNVVVTTIVVQVGVWRGWDDARVLVLGGVIGIIGVNASVALLKKYLGRV